VLVKNKFLEANKKLNPKFASVNEEFDFAVQRRKNSF
jgi:hypothetical protein